MSWRAKRKLLEQNNTRYYREWQAEKNSNYVTNHQINIQIDNIIVAFGLCDTYPLKSMTGETEFQSVTPNGFNMQVPVHTYGRVAFLADINLAAAAANGKEAADRIATAVSNLRRTK